MSALVQRAASEIEQRLFDQGSERERALLRAFLVASRRGGQAVLTLSDDLVVANTAASQLLGPDDLALVRETAADLAASGRDAMAEISLTGGQLVKLRCRPVLTSSGTAGAVAELSVRHDDRHLGGVSERGGPHLSPLPGLAGRSSAWLTACARIAAHSRARSPVLVTGEPGTGKCAIVEAVHRSSFPSAELVILEAADNVGWLDQIRRCLLDATRTVVLRHLARLADETRVRLVVLLREVTSSDSPMPWLVGTSAPAGLDDLEAAFAGTVGVPPLRHHAQDVRDLLPAFLERYGRDRPLACAPEVVQRLLRAPWPGNVAQLERVARLVVLQHRHGRIEAEELPPECYSTGRRVLTPLEELERDAITQALVDSRGDRAEAAERLGISRATVYRKVRAFGIEL
jgi:transcriptional regulator of acetoin/glycerol metabolism